jgi:MoaA/NifB/PqqE/SkfB family radical SAM enzyme
MMNVEIVNFNKRFESDEVNYVFNLRTGLMQTWGATIQEDPQFSPYGPFIADIEITTKCNGIKGKLCPYCYKSNTPNGVNMSFDTFKNVIFNLNRNNQLTQVAFGLGSTGEENPDLWKMCDYLREQNVIPNGTVADVTQETANKIATHFGACAVSCHSLNNKEGLNTCFDSVKRLTDAGCKQVNIHYVLCEETFADVQRVFIAMQSDPRLKGMRALVFLSLKQKGRATTSNLKQLSGTDFNSIVSRAFKYNMNIGFDSCSAHKFENAIVGHPQEAKLKTFSEPCESGLFSIYVNAHGKMYPCSFSEGTEGWENGVDISKPDGHFIDNVWNGGKLLTWREKLLSNNRACPIYQI